MTKSDYAKYQAAVASNLANLRFVSTGGCQGCDACGLDTVVPDQEYELACESWFSWHPCEACGSTLGGNRYAAHGCEKDGSLNHFEVCADCLYYLNYGVLDDQTMLEMDKEQA